MAQQRRTRTKFRADAAEQRAEAWFVTFCGLGPGRSFPKLREIGAAVGLKPVPSLSTFKRWSNGHDWASRVRDYDRQRLLELQEHTQTPVDEMNARQQRIGQLFQTMATRAVSNRGVEGLELESSTSLATMARQGVDIERLAAGEATERTEVMEAALDRFVRDLAEVFIRVNRYPTETQRATEFGVGADALRRSHFPSIVDMEA